MADQRRTLGIQPRRFSRGQSTAYIGVPEYRVHKLALLGIVRGRWLDLGCSDGYYTHALRCAGAQEVVGVDLDDLAIGKAQELWKGDARVEFVYAPAERVPYPGESFSGVLMNEVLEHLPDEHAALTEVRRLLSPTGYLALFSPNRWFPFEGHGAEFGSRRLQIPVPLLPWLPRSLSGPHMIARNYWPSELADTVAAAGFDVVHIDFAFPLMSKFKWAPASWIQRYREVLPTIERLPGIRRFGVSTLVVARPKPWL
jgi:SAM-dependent methyltransferase